MGLPRATAFRFGQSYFEAVFNFYFNSRRDQKRARQIHLLERVAILFLGLRRDARNAPSCFKSSPETMKPQKGRKDDTNIHVLNSCVESLLLKQNPTLIYLRNVKSFVVEQVARFDTAKNGIATRYRVSLWTELFRGCFQFLF